MRHSQSGTLDGKVYEVDTALFAAKVQPMLEKVENPDVRDLLKRIAEVR